MLVSFNTFFSMYESESKSRGIEYADYISKRR